MNKCVFLDRDGVINGDKVDYVYKIEDIRILEGVPEALKKIKNSGFKIVVITNQSGIDKNIYGHVDVFETHREIQKRTGNLIDAFYYSSYHRTITNSLSAKPDSLLFEKAIEKFEIDVNQSWMVGDRVRDLIPAFKLGIKGILLDSEYPDKETFVGNFKQNLLEAVETLILK